MACWHRETGMPYLRFKGFDEGFLREKAPQFVEEFASVAAVPRKKVKIELLPVIRITATSRSLEIFMFPREQGKHDVIAETMDTLLNHFGIQDVHIFFIPLSPRLYYKEGRPLKYLSWLQGYETGENRTNSLGEEVISLNPEDPYEFVVPVKKSKLFLYTFIAVITSILAYVILVEEPSSGWPQNLIHLLVRH